MKFYIQTITLCMGILLSSFSLPKDYWWILGTTSERSAYDGDGQFYWEIKFSDRVEDLDGQRIRLKGYFYNYTDTTITLFTKNKQPFYGCSADPKIMMTEIVNSDKIDFKRNKMYIIEGRLELNKGFHDSNSYTFPYRLSQIKFL